jgi:hypothetical protein
MEGVTRVDRLVQNSYLVIQQSGSFSSKGNKGSGMDDQ